MSKTYFGSLMTTLAAMLLLMAPPVAAQKKPAPAVVMPASGIESIGKGDKEFGIFANYTTYDDADFDFFLLGVSLGRFLTDSLEFKITPAIAYSTGTDGFYSFTFAPFFSLEKMFRGASNRNPVVPYVGVGIGVLVGISDCDTCTYSTDTYGYFAAPVGGLKYFISERASLELALSYQVGSIENCVGGFCDSGDTKTLQQNIRFNFYY